MRREIDISRFMRLDCQKCEKYADYAYVTEIDGHLEVTDARCTEHRIEEEPNVSKQNPESGG